jgi:hypothetical protein
VYELLPSFVLGFHGCDRAIAEKVFAGKATLQASVNDYDWLGHGIYFWENNPRRALDYAKLLKRSPRRTKSRIRNPAVIGAVIDLGYCLNLLDAQFIRMARYAYADLKKIKQQAGREMPTNQTVKGGGDLLLRPLDCAVIETLHLICRDQGMRPFDSARGVFVEGPAIYPGAGINEFNHIQICVRNIKAIKGYFRVLK